MMASAGKCGSPWCADPSRRSRSRRGCRPVPRTEIPNARTSSLCLRLMAPHLPSRGVGGFGRWWHHGEGRRLYGVPPSGGSRGTFWRAVEGTPMQSSRSMMPGAASHIASLVLIGEVAAVDGVVEMLVESPSPFRFLALIPPWRHRVQRFTGTIETGQRCRPSRQFDDSQAASPPPTMILGATAISIHRPSGREAAP